MLFIATKEQKKRNRKKEEQKEKSLKSVVLFFAHKIEGGTEVWERERARV